MSMFETPPRTKATNITTPRPEFDPKKNRANSSKIDLYSDLEEYNELWEQDLLLIRLPKQLFATNDDDDADQLPVAPVTKKRKLN